MRIERALTTKQQEYLEYIGTHIEKYGKSPTNYEISNHFQNDIRNVNDIIKALEKKGFIENPGDFRGMKIIRDIKASTIFKAVL